MGNQINTLDVWQVASILQKSLMANGIARVELGQEIADLEKLIGQLNKPNVGKHFRRSITTLPPNKIRWLSVFHLSRILGGATDVEVDV